MKDQKVYVVCRDKRILCNSDESRDFIFITDGNILHPPEFSMCVFDSVEFHPDFSEKQYIERFHKLYNAGLKTLYFSINGVDFTSLEQFHHAMLIDDTFGINFKGDKILFKKQFYKIKVEIIKILDYEINLAGYGEDCYIKEMILTEKKD